MHETQEPGASLTWLHNPLLLQHTENLELDSQDFQFSLDKSFVQTLGEQ